MTKLIRFVALVGLLGLSSWLAMEEHAFAYPPCSVIAGNQCSPTGARTFCDPDGLCTCIGGHWDCGE
jgi:hypothetical protein